MENTNGCARLAIKCYFGALYLSVSLICFAAALAWFLEKAEWRCLSKQGFLSDNFVSFSISFGNAFFQEQNHLQVCAALGLQAEHRSPLLMAF